MTKIQTEIPVALGKLTITSFIENIADTPVPLSFVTHRTCRYEGELPRDIMLALVRYSESIAPGSVTINGMTVLEYLEAL